MITFESLFKDETRLGTKIKTDDYLEHGRHPIVDQGQNEVAGYTNLEDGIYSDVPAVIFGDHTRVIKYIDEPFFLGADGTKILKGYKPHSNQKYLYYALRAAKIPNLGYSRHFKCLKELKFVEHSEDEQQQIVAEFDKLSEIISLKMKELSLYDELVKARFVEMFGDFDLAPQYNEWTKLSELGEIVSGSTPKTGSAEYWDGDICWITPAELNSMSGIVYDSKKKITEAGKNSCSLRLMPVNTIILSSRAPIGKVAILGKEMCCNQGFKNVICNEKILPKYLYYLLAYNTDYLNSLGRGATFKEISKKIVEDIKIPLPSIEQQVEFINFAERVDRSTNQNLPFRSLSKRLSNYSIA